RRRPDARWRKSPADVAALGPLQRSLLRSAIDAARPGGVIAYVTCSPHVAETRAVVGEVTAARDDVLLLDAPALLSEVPDLACPGLGGRYAQFWPHLHGTDAIFLALLQRVGPGGRPPGTPRWPEAPFLRHGALAVLARASSGGFGPYPVSARPLGRPRRAVPMSARWPCAYPLPYPLPL